VKPAGKKTALRWKKRPKKSFNILPTGYRISTPIKQDPLDRWLDYWTYLLLFFAIGDSKPYFRSTVASNVCIYILSRVPFPYALSRRSFDYLDESVCSVDRLTVAFLF